MKCRGPVILIHIISFSYMEVRVKNDWHLLTIPIIFAHMIRTLFSAAVPEMWAEVGLCHSLSSTSPSPPPHAATGLPSWTTPATKLDTGLEPVQSALPIYIITACTVLKYFENRCKFLSNERFKAQTEKNGIPATCTCINFTIYKKHERTMSCWRE